MDPPAPSPVPMDCGGRIVRGGVTVYTVGTIHVTVGLDSVRVSVGSRDTSVRRVVQKTIMAKVRINETPRPHPHSKKINKRVDKNACHIIP